MRGGREIVRDESAGGGSLGGGGGIGSIMFTAEKEGACGMGWYRYCMGFFGTRWKRWGGHRGAYMYTVCCVCGQKHTCSSKAQFYVFSCFVLNFRPPSRFLLFRYRYHEMDVRV